MDEVLDGKVNILLNGKRQLRRTEDGTDSRIGITGGIASYKIADLVSRLKKRTWK